MASTHKSSDAGNLHTAKRSCKVLPFSEKVEVLVSIIRKNKNPYTEFAKNYCKTNLLPMKLR